MEDLRLKIERHPDDELEITWENEQGRFHNPWGPAFIVWSGKNSIVSKTYFINGITHRGNGKPAHVEYDSNGHVIKEEYYVDGKLHRDNGPAVVGYDHLGRTKYAVYFYYGRKTTESGLRELLSAES